VQTLNPLRERHIAQWIFGFGKTKNWFQRILRAIVILAIGFTSLYLATLFSIPLNLIFDGIKNTFH
jgi:hypothetical protein